MPGYDGSGYLVCSKAKKIILNSGFTIIPPIIIVKYTLETVA